MQAFRVAGFRVGALSDRRIYRARDYGGSLLGITWERFEKLKVEWSSS